MTRYFVSNSKGSFEKGDFGGGGSSSSASSSDSTSVPMRQPATPQRATTIPIMH